MFKAFLLASALFLQAFSVRAQEPLSAEDLLTKYTNARALCARITDPFALYERGILLLSDANEDAYLAAAECFMGAAVRNHTESQIELGYLYERGHGVVQSNIFAYKWYQTAVLLGNKNAVRYRDKLEKTISLDDITAALPMIQKTLELIEAYTAEQEKEITEREEKIAKLYKDKFGINLKDYEVKQPESSFKRSNFLLDNSVGSNQNNQQSAPNQNNMNQQQQTNMPQRNAGPQQQGGAAMPLGKNAAMGRGATTTAPSF